MIPRLNRLRGFIEWASCVSGITSSTGIIRVIVEPGTVATLRVGEIHNSITNGPPGFILRLKEGLLSSKSLDSLFVPVGEIRSLSFGDLVALPVIARHPLVSQQR